MTQQGAGCAGRLQPHPHGQELQPIALIDITNTAIKINSFFIAFSAPFLEDLFSVVRCKNTGNSAPRGMACKWNWASAPGIRPCKPLRCAGRAEGRNSAGHRAMVALSPRLRQPVFVARGKTRTADMAVVGDKPRSCGVFYGASVQTTDDNNTSRRPCPSNIASGGGHRPPCQTPPATVGGGDQFVIPGG